MRKAWLLFSQTVTIAVALLFVVATLKPQWLHRAPGELVDASPAPAAAPRQRRCRRRCAASRCSAPARRP